IQGFDDFRILLAQKLGHARWSSFGFFHLRGPSGPLRSRLAGPSRSRSAGQLRPGPFGPLRFKCRDTGPVSIAGAWSVNRRRLPRFQSQVPGADAPPGPPDDSARSFGEPVFSIVYTARAPPISFGRVYAAFTRAAP